MIEGTTRIHNAGANIALPLLGSSFFLYKQTNAFLCWCEYFLRLLGNKFYWINKSNTTMFKIDTHRQINRWVQNLLKTFFFKSFRIVRQPAMKYQKQQKRDSSRANKMFLLTSETFRFPAGSRPMAAWCTSAWRFCLVFVTQNRRHEIAIVLTEQPSSASDRLLNKTIFKP